MSGAVVQTAYTVDDSGGTSTTVSATLNGVVAGNTLIAFIGRSNSNTVSTVSDGASYTRAGSAVADTTNNQGSDVFYLENVSSGSHTVTVTFSGATSFRRLRFIEASGLAAASSVDAATQNAQNSPGTTTDAVTSTATSTANASDWLLGLTQDTLEIDPGTGTLTAGTNYTISGSNIIMGVESRNVSATGSYAATFTQSVNNGRTTHIVAFKQSSNSLTVSASGGIVLSGQATVSYVAPGWILLEDGTSRILLEDSSGKIAVEWGIPTGGTNSFSYTATGGMTLSGASTQSRARAVAATGGITTSGTATQLRKPAWTPSGGITLSGAATRNRGFQYSASGGINLSGLSPSTRARSATAVGGLVFSGSAGFSTGGTQSFSYTASGGMVLSGVSTFLRARAYSPVGGIALSGTSAASRSRSATSSGGITFSGANVALRARAALATGGVVFAGSSAQLRTASPNPSGGLILSGTAPGFGIPAGGGGTVRRRNMGLLSFINHR